MPGAYYNEIDPFAAAWLRELIKAGAIADGEVDTRSIVDVSGAELAGFVQCHFFAGIGGWSFALRLAGWPDDRPVWSGSCPCQPFSSAGRGDGADDPRHLWPAWVRLIGECRPGVVFGEQVASVDGLAWFDRVATDLEDLHYAVGAANLPAASVGAWHKRSRLWFVGELADTYGEPDEQSVTGGVSAAEGSARERGDHRIINRGDAGELADADHQRCEGDPVHVQQRRSRSAGVDVARDGAAGELADADGWHTVDGELQRGGQYRLRAEGRHADGRAGDGERAEAGLVGDAAGDGREAGQQQNRALVGDASRESGLEQSGTRPAGELGDTDGRRWPRVGGRGQTGTPESGEAGGFWADTEWIPCRDGKWRPVEPGAFPLAHGVPGRVGRLRGYGNAIVPEVAATFIAAYLEARGGF